MLLFVGFDICTDIHTDYSTPYFVFLLLYKISEQYIISKSYGRVVLKACVDYQTTAVLILAICDERYRRPKYGLLQQCYLSCHAGSTVSHTVGRALLKTDYRCVCAIVDYQVYTTAVLTLRRSTTKDEANRSMVYTTVILKLLRWQYCILCCKRLICSCVPHGTGRAGQWDNVRAKVKEYVHDRTTNAALRSRLR